MRDIIEEFKNEHLKDGKDSLYFNMVEKESILILYGREFELKLRKWGSDWEVTLIDRKNRNEVARKVLPSYKEANEYYLELKAVHIDGKKPKLTKESKTPTPNKPKKKRLRDYLTYD